MTLFHCYKCKLRFAARHFNVARITVICPTCETPNHISQSLTRTYGKVAGEQVSKIMVALENLLSRSRQDCTNPINAAYAKIVDLCQTAKAAV